MSITWFMKEYHTGKGWGAAEVALQGKLLSENVFEHKKPADYLRALEKAGISYRKTNMLEDFRRAEAVEWSGNYKKANNANRWFNFVQGYRREQYKKTGKLLPWKECAKYFKRYQEMSFETTEEAKEAEDLAEEYYAGR